MNKEVYEDSIILIGPSGAGKSTVGKELAEILKMKRVCLDGIANNARDRGIRAKISEEAIRQGKNPKDTFSLAMIQHLLKLAEEYNNPGITDFGAGHVVFNTADGCRQAKALLKPFKNVVLLLPCKDKEKALKRIEERSTANYRNKEEFLKTYFQRYQNMV